MQDGELVNRLERTLRAFVLATRQPGSFQPPSLPEEFEVEVPAEELETPP